MPFYAVREGYNPGVYTSWRACEPEVKYYSGADFRKFNTEQEVYEYLNEGYEDGWEYDEDDVEDVYTDGACVNNGYYGAAAGIGVFWGDWDDDRNVSERHTGRQTNNSAEIHAAIRAIEQADFYGVPEINLHTDSRFLIQAVTTWIDGWKQYGWITADGYPVRNMEDFQELDHLLCNTYVNVNWIHVRAHSGDYGNEAADEMARDGCWM